jgi:uncharacterized repeat protein (TIGR01451 family)
MSISRWALLLWLALLCLPAALAQQTFAPRYLNRAVSGDIVLIGNAAYHCTTAAPASSDQASACASARNGGTVINNNVYMLPVDKNGSPASSSSSSATLSLPTGSSVLFAGLYWNGRSASAANRATVTFAGPSGSGGAVSASSTAVIDNLIYQSFADVTGQVQAGGLYTVSGIGSTAGLNSWAGWTLVVAYRSAALPTRNLAVFDGLQVADNASVPVDIGVSGFVTPSVGPVRSVIGVVAYDGDRGNPEGAGAGGSLQFGSSRASLTPVSNAVNPVNDVFNSTISTLGAEVSAPRSPSFQNTLGLDIDTFTPNTPLPNNSTSAVVRVIGTASDVIYPGVITLATDIFAPNIKDNLTKTVTDLNGGVLVPGDTLEYEVVVKNSGQDGSKNVVLSDVLPANVSLVPGSLLITGLGAGSRTDAAGDDQAEYSAGNRTLTFRLGTGSSASAGGLLLPGEESRVRFRVVVNAGTPGGTIIDNSATVNYLSQTLNIPVIDVSDSDAAVPGDQPARTVVAGPDLTLTKTHVGTAAEGGTASFTLRVSNAGPAASFGAVTVSDILPAGLSALSASGEGWTCTLAPLSCSRNDALIAGGNYPDLIIRVQVAAGTSGKLTNTASVLASAEGSQNTGNNSASDTLTVQPRPGVTLSKTVRNVSAGGAAGTSGTARPGDTLEYCIAFANTGGDAPDFRVQDDAPTNSRALPNAYGPGLAAQLTVGGTSSTLTAAADTDAASLISGRLMYAHGTLAQGQSGRVCFQVQVN